MTERLRLFHGTLAAKDILSEGFRDGSGTYMTSQRFEGVFLSDRPLDVNEGAPVGAEILEVLVEGELIADFEWIEEGKGYREWCVPAALLNRHGTVAPLGDSPVAG